MATTPFMIVVDTTHTNVLTSFPNAIIDVQLIKATDEDEARQIFLKSIPANLAQQLQHNLYIFHLSSMLADMDLVEQNGGIPAFKFVLPGNKRPPKSTSLAQRVSTQLGNVTITQPNDSATVDNRTQNDAPSQPVAPTSKGEQLVQNVTKSARSNQFQEKEYVSRSAPSHLSEEQASIINNLGAGQRLEGSNEAVNGQVNAAVGGNQNLQAQPVEQLTTDQLTPEQQALANKVGATVAGPPLVNGSGTDITEQQASESHLVDPGLSELSETALSDNAIQELQNEGKGNE